MNTIMGTRRFQIYLASLAYLASLSSISWAEFDPKAWTSRQKLQGQAEKTAYVEVPLTDEVMGHSLPPRYHDVRIIGEAGHEVPYVLREFVAEDGVKEVPATVLSRTVIPGESTSCVLDMGRKGKWANRVTIQTPNIGFSRKVWVEGSDDGNTWKPLVKDGYILALAPPSGYARMTEVPFPQSAFRYLRLRVWLTGETEPFVFDGVVVLQVVKKPGRERTWSYVPGEPIKVPDEKAVEWIVDRGRSGLPMEQLELVVGDQNYHRRLSVWTSDDKKSWNSFVQEAIMFGYRGTDEASSQTRFSGHGGFGRYVKIKMWNGDNPPLTLQTVHVKGWVRAVVFQAEKGKSYGLYYGNHKAGAPQYDLAQLAPKLIGNTTEWKGGAEEANPQFVPPVVPLSERKGLVGGVLTAVAAVLGYFLWKTFQQITGGKNHIG